MGTFWYTRDTDKVLEVGGANAYPSNPNATFNGTETVSKYGQYAVKFSVAGSIMYYNITENLNVSHVYDLINYN